MHAFSSSKSKPELSALIEHDLKSLRDKPAAQVYMQVKTILKALTGRPHEYTIEEALFILREEKIVTEEEYDRLKPLLVGLVFYKYATHYDFDAKIDFISLGELLAQAAKRSDTPIEVYAQMRSNPVGFPEDTSGHDLIKQHKKELYAAEQQLFKEMSSSNKANINFPDTFHRVTGFTLKEISKIDRNTTNWKDMALEIHVKYQLVKGKDVDWIIRQYVKDTIPEKEIKKVLTDNISYLDSIQDITYLKDMILVILAFAFCIVTDKSLDEEEALLVNLGYDADHISFVREQITKRI